MRRILLATLLLAVTISAEPALQSRPPGLDLTGARIAALDEKVRQAEQAIDDMHLTIGKRAARNLLREVLTADPSHRGALAALERLIGALADHAQSKLEQQPPDLDGAREYARKALTLAAADRGASADARRAYLYYDIATAQRALNLRSEKTTLSFRQFGDMLKTKGLFESSRNPNGAGYPNQFVNNQDGTVTDRTSGLMWQQGGSAKTVSYADAQDYVEQLNRERFAGHDGWRLPTVEEAASLLEPESSNDMHIDPVFDTTQYVIWTADKFENDGSRWNVFFFKGHVSMYVNANHSIYYARACRTSGR